MGIVDVRTQLEQSLSRLTGSLRWLSTRLTAPRGQNDAWRAKPDEFGHAARVEEDLT